MKTAVLLGALRSKALSLKLVLPFPVLLGNNSKAYILFEPMRRPSTWELFSTIPRVTLMGGGGANVTFDGEVTLLAIVRPRIRQRTKILTLEGVIYLQIF